MRKYVVFISLLLLVSIPLFVYADNFDAHLQLFLSHEYDEVFASYFSPEEDLIDFEGQIAFCNYALEKIGKPDLDFFVDKNLQQAEYLLLEFSLPEINSDYYLLEYIKNNAQFITGKVSSEQYESNSQEIKKTLSQYLLQALDKIKEAESNRIETLKQWYARRSGKEISKELESAYKKIFTPGVSAGSEFTPLENSFLTGFTPAIVSEIKGFQALLNAQQDKFYILVDRCSRQESDFFTYLESRSSKSLISSEVWSYLEDYLYRGGGLSGNTATIFYALLSYLPEARQDETLVSDSQKLFGELISFLKGETQKIKDIDGSQKTFDLFDGSFGGVNRLLVSIGTQQERTDNILNYLSSLQSSNIPSEYGEFYTYMSDQKTFRLSSAEGSSKVGYLIDGYKRQSDFYGKLYSQISNFYEEYIQVYLELITKSNAILDSEIAGEYLLARTQEQLGDIEFSLQQLADKSNEEINAPETITQIFVIDKKGLTARIIDAKAKIEASLR